MSHKLLSAVIAAALALPAAASFGAPVKPAKAAASAVKHTAVVKKSAAKAHVASHAKPKKLAHKSHKPVPAAAKGKAAHAVK